MRVLPIAEWPRLDATEAREVWRLLPGDAQPLVVERDGEIVGEWTLVLVPHVECLWKRGDAGTGVSRMLLRGMRRLVRELGASAVVTAALSEDVRALLAHRGARRLDGDHFVMEMS